jgi:hypothetical protein
MNANLIKKWQVMSVAAMTILVTSTAWSGAGVSQIDDPNSITSIECALTGGDGDAQASVTHIGDRKFNVKISATTPTVRNLSYSSDAIWSGHFWIFSSKGVVLRTRDLDTTDATISIHNGVDKQEITPLHCLMNPSK